MACHANGSLYVVFGRHAHRLSADLSRCAATRCRARARITRSCCSTTGSSSPRTSITRRASRRCTACSIPTRSSRSARTFRCPSRRSRGSPRTATRSTRSATTRCSGSRGTGGRSCAIRTWSYRYRDAPRSELRLGRRARRRTRLVHGPGRARLRRNDARRGPRKGRDPAPSACRSPTRAITTRRRSPGLAYGTCTNPPVYDPARRIAIAYDSGNGVIAAWRHTEAGALEPLWQRELATAGHLIRFADTGLLLAYDFRAPAFFRTRAFRARRAGSRRSRRGRRRAARTRPRNRRRRRAARHRDGRRARARVGSDDVPVGRVPRAGLVRTISTTARSRRSHASRSDASPGRTSLLLRSRESPLFRS